MFRGIVFNTDYHCFAKGSIFTLHRGVNLLVGDQGCGKSTLLEAIAGAAAQQSDDSAKAAGKRPPRRKSFFNEQVRQAAHLVWDGPPGRFGYFDFEKGNPRVQAALGMVDGYDTGFQVSSMFSSHGQATNALLGMFEADIGPNVLAADEPDMSLSPRSIHALIRNLQKHVGEHSQVLMSAHNPMLIAAFPEVLSLEHERWMPSEEFLELQRTTPAPEFSGKEKRLVVVRRPKAK